MLKDFKDFAVKGNVVDLAVGVIIGAAFGAIVKSLVDDIIMPPIGYLLGNVDFSNFFIVIKQGPLPGPYNTLADALKAGAVVMKVGLFINTIVSFLIIAFTVFLLVKQIQKLKKEEEAQAETTHKEEVALLTQIRDLLKK